VCGSSVVSVVVSSSISSCSISSSSCGSGNGSGSVFLSIIYIKNRVFDTSELSLIIEGTSRNAICNVSRSSFNLLKKD
jgi:hypothetical protein